MRHKSCADLQTFDDFQIWRCCRSGKGGSSIALEKQVFYVHWHLFHLLVNDNFCISEKVPILTEQLNTSSHLERTGWRDFLGFIRLILRCLVIAMKYIPFPDKMWYGFNLVVKIKQELLHFFKQMFLKQLLRVALKLDLWTNLGFCPNHISKNLIWLIIIKSKIF